MIGMSVRYCICDDEPIETSRAYAMLTAFHGPEIADKLTYEVDYDPARTAFINAGIREAIGRDSYNNLPVGGCKDTTRDPQRPPR